jgi:hypothetical protein
MGGQSCGKEGSMRRAAAMATVVATVFLALPGLGAADPKHNVLPVQLTCGGETLALVAPASGQSTAGLFVGSTSVGVLMGVDEFIIPGFTEEDLTQCTARLPSGESFTAWVLITPRA